MHQNLRQSLKSELKEQIYGGRKPIPNPILYPQVRRSVGLRECGASLTDLVEANERKDKPLSVAALLTPNGSSSLASSLAAHPPAEPLPPDGALAREARGAVSAVRPGAAPRRHG